MKKQTEITRRELLGGAAAVTAFTIVPRHVLAGSGQQAPSDKLNVGKIGCGGMQGGGDLRNISSENIYALCDVDETQGGSAFLQYPDAKLYKDFRNMLDREQNNLDAVCVTIPDHMHGTAALWAMERGIHCYVQKPLVQSVWEARLMAKAQKKYPNVVTQMGNQGYSSVATRRACEIIWNGDLGDITEVHSMTAGAANRARGVTVWPPEEPVPDTLQWDLWQGHAQPRPYSSTILPMNWRGYLDYGTQSVGDWSIHQLGPANWALGLHKTYPTSVTCIEVEGTNDITWPNYAFVLEFPERDHPYKAGEKMPPVKIYWYEGSVYTHTVYKIPEGLTAEDFSPYNEIFFGTKGCMGTSGRGESVSLIPRSKQEGYTLPPEMIERVPNGHFQNWIDACKGGKSACSNFSIAAPYVEYMMVGSISWRFPNEKLEWDGENMRFTNNDKANEYIKPYFRPGWELEDITI